MFRFTIRDVLWLTVVAALAVGWALDHWQLSSYVRHLEDLIPSKYPESSNF